MQNHEFDFLVLGSGVAGLSTALHAAKRGKVALVTKSSLQTSSSYFAQGGIAAVLSDKDSFESHIKDTLKAGADLCDEEAVKVLVEDGSQRVRELIELGMEFDKNDGNLVFGLEGAHSHNRVLHANGDATGKRVVEFLVSKVIENNNIKIFENVFVYKLNVSNNKCNGFSGFNYLKNDNINFFAPFTMLATGGASAIYNRTTNPKSSSGDGIYLAYEAGAEISGMEFIQFHPSSLVTKTDYTYLISEAVRGEGAYLVNSNNERFMLNKHEKAELAPRDLVAYEIYKQWQIPNNRVFLSLLHLDKEKIRNRFRNINLELNKYNLDIATDLIPVSPAAHYMIGGVKSNINGETNIPGLFVAGEVASTGVHGANRLASNSLLECLVFSKRAVDNFTSKGETIYQRSINNSEFYLNEKVKNSILREKQNIAKLLFEYIGITRTESQMKKFSNIITDIEGKIKFQKDEYYSFQLKSILTIARLMSTAAMVRKESRGAHKREDYRNSDTNFLLEIIQQKGADIKLNNIKTC